jgi:gag-polypeptide of LTR copia-type
MRYICTSLDLTHVTKASDPIFSITIINLINTEQLTVGSPIPVGKGLQPTRGGQYQIFSQPTISATIYKLHHILNTSICSYQSLIPEKVPAKIPEIPEKSTSIRSYQKITRKFSFHKTSIIFVLSVKPKPMAPQPETSTKLMNIMLNELNYLSWVRVVKISLKGRGKLGLVTGIIKKPSLSPVPTTEEIKAQEQWEMQDQEVIS